jgi:hypothetical protein
MSKPEVTAGGTAFRDIIAAGTPVVWDGAMGSNLYEQGILHTRAFEECNLTATASSPFQPVVLRASIHRVLFAMFPPGLRAASSPET